MALFQLLKMQNYSFVDLKAFCVKYITLSANRMGPRSFWMYDCQGELCLEQGLHQAAITSFQKVLKSKNQDPVLWEKLGTAHFKANRISSAQKVFNFGCILVLLTVLLVFYKSFGTESNRGLCFG